MFQVVNFRSFYLDIDIQEEEEGYCYKIKDSLQVCDDQVNLTARVIIINITVELINAFYACQVKETVLAVVMEIDLAINMVISYVIAII